MNYVLVRVTVHCFHSSGGIDWGFYQVHVDDLDEDGITSYKSVASVLNQLALLELRDSNSTVGTLQILETVFRKFHHQHCICSVVL